MEKTGGLVKVGEANCASRTKKAKALLARSPQRPQLAVMLRPWWGTASDAF